MRIFLTGPTGYIGGAVLDALVRAGHTVTGLVRDKSRARKFKKRGIEAVVGIWPNRGGGMPPSASTR